jgi:hypothetical protein
MAIRARLRTLLAKIKPRWRNSGRSGSSKRI